MSNLVMCGLARTTQPVREAHDDGGDRRIRSRRRIRHSADRAEARPDAAGLAGRHLRDGQRAARGVDCGARELPATPDGQLPVADL